MIRKGDYDAAITQYIRTIGYVEPSYVIRKFLDAQKMKHLIQYLEEIHRRRLASPEHMTLLINCYTKSGNGEKLEKFIKGDNGEMSSSFDYETVIRICRSSGYTQLAAYLAEKSGDYSTYYHS